MTYVPPVCASCSVALEWVLECREAARLIDSSPLVCDQNHRTVLHHACIWDFQELVNLLLNNGADPCAADKVRR